MRIPIKPTSIMESNQYFSFVAQIIRYIRLFADWFSWLCCTCASEFWQGTSHRRVDPQSSNRKCPPANQKKMVGSDVFPIEIYSPFKKGTCFLVFRWEYFFVSYVFVFPLGSVNIIERSWKDKQILKVFVLRMLCCNFGRGDGYSWCRYCWT